MAQIVEVIGVGNVEFPDGMSKEQIGLALQKLPKPNTENQGTPIYGDLPTAMGGQPNIVRYEKQPEQPKKTMVDYAKALYEVPATVLSGAVAPFIGVGKGIVENMQQGTNNRVDRPELAQQFTYQPTSPVSQDVLSSMGEALNVAKIPAYVPNVGNVARATQQAGRTTAPMVAGNLPSFDNASQVVKTAPTRIADLLREREQPTLSGVGAAQVPQVNQRVQLAQNLRVPMQLSKGQATRDLGQQAFEAETPKNFPELGKPLVEAQAKRNDVILQNFDAYFDATGKETYGLRETGKVVDRALVNKVNKVNKEINDAYTLAREKGETQEPINYAPLTAYIADQTPTVRSKLAPILDAVDEQLKKNDPKGTGQIAINQLEDIYQFMNKNYDPADAVANGHVRQMKNLINTVTEGKGGENYQQARALRAKFGREFENIGAIDKLLRTKKGTDDRAVAFEDVFKFSVLDSSLDDLRNIGITLKKAGPEGEQAFKELQGQTIEYIKDQVTRNIDTDSFGNPVVSPAKFKSVVRELDQDGKLDYLFGKKGAQEVRDLLEATILVNAPLKGAVNQSNTASAFIRAMDKIKASPLAKLPLVKSSADYGISREIKKQVQESVDFDPNAVAKELRKGK
jgi:hypothetical protein